MILYGASGHGKVVFSICKEQIEFFVDDDPFKSVFCGKPVVPSKELSDVGSQMVITIGNNDTRKKIAKQVSRNFAKVLSSSSTIDSSVDIGVGSQIIHNSLIQCDVKIGKHCIVNSMSSIDHECVIGDYVHLAPSSTLCGNVSVGEGSLIGAGAVVIPNISIGKWCIIGAGSIITRDVPDYATVVGNPGRIIKINEPK